MIYLPDTNACITLLRRKSAQLNSRWQAMRVADIALCSIVVYELRYGAEHAPDSIREHAKLDLFLNVFVSLPFDDTCATKCAQIRNDLERAGTPIGPHDLQIASIAMTNNLTLVTHNTREFARVSNLKIEDWET